MFKYRRIAKVHDAELRDVYEIAAAGGFPVEAWAGDGWEALRIHKSAGFHLVVLIDHTGRSYVKRVSTSYAISWEALVRVARSQGLAVPAAEGSP